MAGPLAISWSGLRRYENCPQRHLRIIQGQAKAKASDQRKFLAGTVADLTMREWLDTDDPQPGQMVTHAEVVFERLTDAERSQDRDKVRAIQWKGDPAKDRANILSFVKEVVTELEPVLLRDVVPYRYQPELRFETLVAIPYLDGKLTTVKLIGGIDIVVQDDEDQFVCYDLKATKDPHYIDKVLGQAVFYDLAFGHWWGDTTQPQRFGFIFPACPEKVRYVKISDDERRVMMQRIMRMAHGMWKRDWTPKEDDEGCQYCEAKHVCDKFKVVVEVDAKGRNRASFAAAADKRRRIYNQ